MTGRPSDFTSEIAEQICERLAEGNSLRSICEAEDMPSKTTVFRWLNAFPDFRDQYARAREAQADALFDEILDIADTPITGEKTKVDKDGNVIEMTKADMIEHRRLQIEARKWMAGKLRPKVYGDKLDIDLNSKVNFVINAKPMTEADWLKEHGSDDDK
ncbi:terminase small subunit protein [Rhizobium sp. JAB6]|uniref:terminase small subunit-like protein n=1 Tax=Rhizobium sp. JAB6 TaxID=2127050 RepID=UPI0015E6EEDC|nr:terminase small subunit protein [Rhizobium sp. JAB6]